MTSIFSHITLIIHQEGSCSICLFHCKQMKHIKKFSEFSESEKAAFSECGLSEHSSPTILELSQTARFVKPLLTLSSGLKSRWALPPRELRLAFGIM